MPTLAAKAFQQAYAQAGRHYENFPVVSWVLPPAMREPVLALYGFCRAVDDLGDEAAGDRLAWLDGMEAEVRLCFRGTASPGLLPLQYTIHRFRLPQQPFLDLIEANRMDQRQRRYPRFDDLLHYCRHSANPVGRLFLALFGYHDEERQRLADAICTGLQLTNFWQDVGRDLAKGRIYLPQEDLARFQYSEAQLEAGVANGAFRRLMAFQVERAHGFFREGRPLLDMLDGRLRHHVAMFIEGGEYILRRIAALDYNVLATRPTLPPWRKGWMVAKALFRARLGWDPA